MDKLKYFTKSLFTKLESLRILVWFLFFIIYPIFYLSYVRYNMTFIDSYKIESKHYSYNDNNEKEFNFNVIKGSGKKRTETVSKEKYDGCIPNEIYYVDDHTLIMDFFVISYIFLGVILIFCNIDDYYYWS